MARASMAKTHPAASNGLAPSTAPGQPNAEPWLGEKERFMLLLIAPAGTVLVLFQIVPIIFGANASFRDWQLSNPAQTWVGLKHYLYILSVSCPRFFWTPICPTGGRYGEVQYEQDQT